jgi:methionyl-tRNA formyltransferase
VGNYVPLWYLNTFGCINFFLLSIFSILRIIRTIKKLKLFSFKKISQKFKIDIVYLKELNSDFLKTELIRKKTDIVLIHTTHILKKDILQIPDIRFINLFCGNSQKIQGVMPYFWSFLQNINTCMTFHIVTEKINHGKILEQIHFRDQKLSMVGFYKRCFEKYPVFIKKAIKKSFKKTEETKFINQNYFSYPDKQDFIRFSKKGGKIISIRDIF